MVTKISAQRRQLSVENVVYNQSRPKCKKGLILAVFYLDECRHRANQCADLRFIFAKKRPVNGLNKLLDPAEKVWETISKTLDTIFKILEAISKTMDYMGERTNKYLQTIAKVLEATNKILPVFNKRI